MNKDAALSQLCEPDASLISRITSTENMEKAYSRTQKGKAKYRREALMFSKDETSNLLKLQQEIRNGSYMPEPLFVFKVFEPKPRLIHAPHYRDKIVQIAVINVLKKVYQPRFIYHTYSCLDDKGTHKCVTAIYKMMRKAKWEYGTNAYIVKIDFRKFFYSIDRDILKRILLKRINCPEAYALICKIVNVSESMGDKGLPLGNATSQLFANILLNEVDQYAKRRLKIRHYVRYNDDIVIIANGKEKARSALSSIGSFADVHLNLQLNCDKSKIFPIEQGVNTVGFKIYSTHLLLRNDSKKKIKRKLSKFKRLLIEEKITPEKVEQILNSWLGHAKQCNYWNFLCKLLNKFDYIQYVNDALKVNLEVINNAISNQQRIRTISVQSHNERRRTLYR